MTTLLGGLGACGDGEDTPTGNGGTSTGGKGSGNGGAAGMGGSKVSGGSSGSAAKGGNGGSSGASAGGAGGTPADAGEAGALGEGGTAPNAGASGSGGAELSVEYRGCETGAAITRIALYRIDRAQQICTLVMVQQGQVNCLEGLKSEGWCVIGAAIGTDIEACEAFQMPSDPVQATAGEGTFTISTQPLAIDIDIDFEFPASSGLPGSVSFAADNCLADCSMSDCRP